MDSYREYLVVGEFKEDSSLQPGQEVIDIGEIQPFEPLLFESHVKFFLDDPKRIFSQEQDLRLIFKDGMPFKCFVQNGSHRLYVSNKLGIKKVVIERVEDLQWDHDFELFFESAMEAYDLGVRSWEQVKVIEDLKLLEIFSKQDDATGVYDGFSPFHMKQIMEQ
ncbi:MAG TPA: hypothetical protein DDY52_02245 [Candidatus Moranbacteria bacterium]|nr:MAG: hypothetical protein UR51_C0008G0043 [Candidatus Moranbacteria bacterium GW2011_GWF1_34_10]HBI16955.1 hypothetical protein [Candidatus Moranbacteria bacterium]